MRHLVLVLAAASLLCSVTAGRGRKLSQAINFSGSGCGDVPPGPPANLKATPGNRQVTLNWDRPTNGGCVDEYAISVRPVGAQMSALATAQQQTTPDYEYTVQNLQNGQEYEFTVTAISNKYSNQAQSASVKATPTSGTVNQLCSIYIYPTSPTNLRVENQTANSTTLCWDPPASQGCVDYYNLNVEPVSQNRQSFAASSPIRIQSTRCYTVKNLTSGVRYKATVQAYNEVYNGGGTATKEFTQ